jgi:hypothetical protein
MKLKKCVRCSSTKYVEEFAKKISSKDGLTSACKVCLRRDNKFTYIKYIESKWYENMNWSTHGKGPGTWQIDHIIELQDVDLTNKEELSKIIHYTNLQPLWLEDHINKG